MTDAHGGYGGHYEQERPQGASHTGGVGGAKAAVLGSSWPVHHQREAAIHLAGKIIEAQIGLKDVKAPHAIAAEAWQVVDALEEAERNAHQRAPIIGATVPRQSPLLDILSRLTDEVVELVSRHRTGRGYERGEMPIGLMGAILRARTAALQQIEANR